MVILKEPIAYFDVDDTLVSWEQFGQYDPSLVAFEDPISQGFIYLKPIREHIDAIKAHKLRGHTIVVWSAGGAEWAKVVVQTLGLTGYVDACASKPDWFYDDIPSSKFMPENNRLYFLKGNLDEAREDD